MAIPIALANSCRGFSCPAEHLEEELLQTIACEYARGVTERFTRKFRPLLEERGEGLARVISDWLARDWKFDDVWQPIFGALGGVLAGWSPLSPLDAGARLGLTIQEQGVPGEWRLSFDSPASVRWGRWPLPV